MIISSLCGVFWNAHIASNFVKKTKICRIAPRRHNEIFAEMSVRRAPNIAYLSVGAAIGGLTSKFLEQVLTGQPLEL